MGYDILLDLEPRNCVTFGYGPKRASPTGHATNDMMLGFGVQLITAPYEKPLTKRQRRRLRGKKGAGDER